MTPRDEENHFNHLHKVAHGIGVLKSTLNATSKQISVFQLGGSRNCFDLVAALSAVE